ncbi:hypothetical protein H3Z83_05045 [Tenacibaculum sp. S7007]|uniref:Uncharacterized protein n=1 Tax=Tenacibaculum pelagium TaxID=2759527 RepID=A0A839AN23_9FLAO|nr:hypothetical protein [Tenacibaculum pelagium]MBA6155886.1 hypothetical protein [Tenacibaculum pelagium]
MIRNTFLTFLFCITSSFCFSQYDWTEGEINLKNGQTVFGLVKIPIISKNFVSFNGKSKIKLKDKTTGSKTKFEEHQVELIKFNYSNSEVAYYKYIPISKKRKEIFCVIFSGKATLYARVVGTSSSNPGMMSSHGINEFYVLRDNEKIATPLITARPSRSFRKRAISYFNDCPTLVEKLKSRVFSKKDIITVIKEYNNCSL